MRETRSTAEQIIAGLSAQERGWSMFAVATRSARDGLKTESYGGREGAKVLEDDHARLKKRLADAIYQRGHQGAQVTAPSGENERRCC